MALRVDGQRGMTERIHASAGPTPDVNVRTRCTAVHSLLPEPPCTCQARPGGRGDGGRLPPHANQPGAVRPGSKRVYNKNHQNGRRQISWRPANVWRNLHVPVARSKLQRHRDDVRHGRRDGRGRGGAGMRGGTPRRGRYGRIPNLRIGPGFQSQTRYLLLRDKVSTRAGGWVREKAGKSAGREGGKEGSRKGWMFATCVQGLRAEYWWRGGLSRRVVALS